jgi:uncharacterized membrane protein required for colicin V production
MKIILIFFLLIISSLVFAQNHEFARQNNTQPLSQVNSQKKVHYVEKRTKPVQNKEAQAHKKPVISKAENQNKSLSK